MSESGLSTAVVLLGDTWSGRHAFASHLIGADGITDVQTMPESTISIDQPGVHVVYVMQVPPQCGGDRAALDRVRAVRSATGTPYLVTAAPAATVSDVTELFRAGASGFVLTSSPAEEVVTCVRAVGAGYPFVSPELLKDVDLSTIRAVNPAPPSSPLTDRELEVLELLAEGASNDQVATALFIAPATVRTHVLSILRKLQARNRTEAVVRAYRFGWLSWESVIGDSHVVGAAAERAV